MHAYIYTYRSDTDPALLAKVGDFFMSHSQFDKAVQLFVTGKQVGRALDLCEKYNVVISEEVCVCMCLCLYVCMYGMELLFVTGKQVGRALDLCEKYNVIITEEVCVHVYMYYFVYVCMCFCMWNGVDIRHWQSSRPCFGSVQEIQCCGN